MGEKTPQIVANTVNAVEQALGSKVNTTTAIVVCFGLTVAALLISKGMDNGYDTVIDSSGKVIQFIKK